MTHPKVETVKVTRRDNITQHQLRLGIALDGEMVDAFLLVPDGKGPFPAVVVVYYDAQTGVGLGTKNRDYGWHLAKRGFIVLSLGRPSATVMVTVMRSRTWRRSRCELFRGSFV